MEEIGAQRHTEYSELTLLKVLSGMVQGDVL